VVQLPGHALQLAEVPEIRVVPVADVAAGVGEGGGAELFPPCPLGQVPQESAAGVEADPTSADSRPRSPIIEGLSDRVARVADEPVAAGGEERGVGAVGGNALEVVAQQSDELRRQPVLALLAGFVAAVGEAGPFQVELAAHRVTQLTLALGGEDP